MTTRPFDVQRLNVSDEGLVSQVIALAGQNKATLGFLPDEAFHERAFRGHLLAAVAEGSVNGYLLFDVLQTRRVRIVQLCISPASRGEGIARALVERLSALYREYLGISLRCRRDYEANAMWPRLNFGAVREIPGRGAGRLPLTVWWRDHGHSDLFTEQLADAPRIVAAIDLNVFLDLHDRNRSGFEESSSLLSDWVPDLLEIATTNQVANEINRLDDSRRRTTQMMALSSYHTLTCSADLAQHVYLNLKDQIDPASYEADASLDDDTMQVAAAIASGAHVFLTRDSAALEVLRGPALDSYDFHLLRPSEVLVHLDELANAVTYKPVELHRTRYAEREVPAGHENELCSTFLNRDDGERKTEFLQLWRSLISLDRWQRQVIEDEEGKPVALLVAGFLNGVFVVQLLRVSAGRVSETLAAQTLLILRRQAREVGARALRIVDKRTSQVIRDAAEQDGYVSTTDGDLIVPVADIVVSFEGLRQWCHDYLPSDVSAFFPAAGAVPVEVAADLERRWWPLKITDSGVPTYIIPIRPMWSTNLFGVPDNLFERDVTLGLSREHVYYRSPRPQPIAEGPARLLWYASGSGKGAINAIIGCSQLRYVTHGTPQELYRRFRHLGVYSLRDIERAARNGLASAVRFDCTELFDHFVSYEQLKSIMGDCRTPTLQSPTRVDQHVFEAVYRRGRRLR